MHSRPTHTVTRFSPIPMAPPASFDVSQERIAGWACGDAPSSRQGGRQRTTSAGTCDRMPSTRTATVAG